MMRRGTVIALTIVALAAAPGLSAAPAHAGEIDLDNAGSSEIRSHLKDLRQRQASEVERLDGLEAERTELHAVIEASERDFATIEAQLERATEALEAANGLEDTVEALGDFRTEQALRYEAAERASERLGVIEPQIPHSAAAIERLTEDITRVSAALEVAEAAESRAAVSVPTNAPDGANAVVQFAYDQLGKPYAFGKAGPDAFDCSGLVAAAYAQAGVSLDRTSQEQWGDSTAIDRSELAPGDLVFSYGTGHIAIYIGGGEVIHASKPGDNVKIAAIDVMPVSGYRRVGR
jgi:peptidoglycan DL-endopeptidase CwlO